MGVPRRAVRSARLLFLHPRSYNVIGDAWVDACGICRCCISGRMAVGGAEESLASPCLVVDACCTGLGRESLYKALSPDDNPALSTILKVVRRSN